MTGTSGVQSQHHRRAAKMDKDPDAFHPSIHRFWILVSARCRGETLFLVSAKLGFLIGWFAGVRRAILGIFDLGLG